MQEFNQGEKVDVYIDSILGDGRGISITEDNKIFVIEGINSDDENVKIEIINSFESLIKAKKVSRTSKHVMNNPEDDDDDSADVYEVDDEEEDDDDDE